MNVKAKRRLVLVGLVILVVAMMLFVFLGSGSTAKALSVADAASGAYDGKKVQVSGTVVNGSYSSEGTTTVFTVSDENDAAQTLSVRYGGALPSTFGNGITAICTGTVSGGVLEANEMITKCPSKYESAEGALTVNLLLTNANTYKGVEGIKVAGYIGDDTLADATADVRFVLDSQGAAIDVDYDGALSDEVTDGVAVVVTGSLADDGKTFVATDVAIDKDVAARQA